MSLGTWKGMKRLGAIVVMMTAGLMGVSAKPEDQAPRQKAGLMLVAKVPLAEFKRGEWGPLTLKGLRAPLEPISDLERFHQDYGFISGGKYVYFGYGNQAMEVATGTWSNQEGFPGDERATQVSEDGSVIAWGYDWFRWDEARGSFVKEKTSADDVLHPDTVTWAGGSLDKPDGSVFLLYTSLRLKNLKSGESSHLPDRYIPEKPGKEEPNIWIQIIEGFTASGSHLLLRDTENQIRLMDTRTMKLLPSDALGDALESDGLAFNCDGSLVAGFGMGYDENNERIGTFIWDRLKRKYMWKNKILGGPVTFSPNDQFLFTMYGKVITTKNGEVVFDGLKGIRGKFSPDGRSLVTVDDEAFYVYTLPKESEPIFGVFQKPGPWSPAKAPAPKPKDKAKTK